MHVLSLLFFQGLSSEGRPSGSCTLCLEVPRGSQLPPTSSFTVAHRYRSLVSNGVRIRVVTLQSSPSGIWLKPSHADVACAYTLFGLLLVSPACSTHLLGSPGSTSRTPTCIHTFASGLTSGEPDLSHNCSELQFLLCM